MHRAEGVNRELAEIRQLLVEITAIPEKVRALNASVLAMNQRLDALNVPKLASDIEVEPPVTRAQLEELETRIEALKVLQAPQVTAASLQALERRLEAKFAQLK